ncbi:MAG: baseplate J/gp47 family protein, partial [Chloroflexota bacterium]|nr:baseplate J/gp47 family protein [Chloroflexota bacterium]
LDETMAVHLPPPEPSRPRRRERPQRPARPPSRLTAILLAALLVLAIAGGAAALPGATVSITPTSQPVSPRVYEVSVPAGGNVTGTTDISQTGTATGKSLELTAATGSVLFYNYSYVSVEVPAGTRVSAGGTVFFTTDARVVAPPGQLTGGDPPIAPGQASVGVTAMEPGTAGNVAAEAIDRVENKNVDRYLQGFGNQKGRRVINPDATSGGDETSHPVIQQSDVDAVVTAIQTQLATQLAGLLPGAGTDRVYAAPGAAEVPKITIPEGLVGKQDTATFDLVGTLAYDRAWARKADVEAAARSRLKSDPAAAPEGMAVVDSSVAIDVGSASASGEQLMVQVTVSGLAATRIDEGTVRSTVAGMTRQEAIAALAGLGKVHIDLWPGWVDRLPKLGFRISVKTGPPTGQ